MLRAVRYTREGSREGSAAFSKPRALPASLILATVCTTLSATPSVVSGFARHRCDWRFVDKAPLQSASADAKKNLESVPDTWRASDTSSLFTGRTSAFPCLGGGGGILIQLKTLASYFNVAISSSAYPAFVVFMPIQTPPSLFVGRSALFNMIF